MQSRALKPEQSVSSADWAGFCSAHQKKHPCLIICSPHYPWAMHWQWALSVIFTDWKTDNTSVRETLAIFSSSEREPKACVLVDAIGADSSRFCRNSLWRSLTWKYKDCGRSCEFWANVGCGMLEAGPNRYIGCLFHDCSIFLKKISFWKYLLQSSEILELVAAFEGGWLLWASAGRDQGMQASDAVKVVSQMSWKTSALVHENAWRRFVANVFAKKSLK